MTKESVYGWMDFHMKLSSSLNPWPLPRRLFAAVLLAWILVLAALTWAALFPHPEKQLSWLPAALLIPLACFQFSAWFWVRSLGKGKTRQHLRTELSQLQSKMAADRIHVERLELMLRDAEEAEMQSLQQSRRLQEVFYQLNHPAAFLDPEGRILDMNAALLDLVGLRAQELRGKSITTVNALEGARSFPKPLLRVAEGETVQFELGLSPEGTEAKVLVMSLKPVFGDAGRVELLILEGHDITERIRAEEALQETFTQFQQSQKMEAIGRLAGGIAHDFNNLLTSILGFSNMAVEEIPETDPVHDDLDEVIQAATRAQNLTQKLLALSRKDVPDSQPLDLNQLLRDMDNLIRVTLHENLELLCTLSESPCFVLADPTSLEQVILNLAVNARDAMPRSGRLYIETEHRRITDRSAMAEAVAPGPYVVLRVRDTGFGMDDDVLNKAFEPFFTTKESGQGTGLGLSTVYAIVKQYQGVIRLTSQPGIGTEFEVLLPRHVNEEQLQLNLPQHTQLPPLPKGDECILLVEDEGGVRRMATRMIESLGYTLLTAVDGEDGVQVAEQSGRKIDLIVTDVVMPNLSGPEMIDRLQLSLGFIPHLYVSGFTMDKLKEHGADDSEQMLIRKPYSRETLARRIRQALDEQKARKESGPLKLP